MGYFATFGNDLYSGRRSIDFVGRRKLWFAIAIAASVVSIAALAILRLNPGIEFRGGSEFRITAVSDTSSQPALAAIASVSAGTTEPKVSTVGTNAVRVQTERLDEDQTNKVADALAKAYDVPTANVTSSFVGPSWGKDISSKAIRALIVFLILVALVISVYFRTWKMAVAAMVALVHDLLLTAGVYALVGFEVTPSSVIGFLTILGYSLYDTVVVFDKVRENTEHVTTSTRRTYAEAANLAVNQTLVRSINTSVVSLLPVGSILFIGAFLLGAGTLRDISLSLFVGIAVGTYSSIFIATPLLVVLREREAPIKAHTEKLLRRRAEGKGPEPVAAVPVTVTVGGSASEPSSPLGGPASEGPSVRETGGPRSQPKRTTKAERGPRR